MNTDRLIPQSCLRGRIDTDEKSRSDDGVYGAIIDDESNTGIISLIINNSAIDAIIAA